MCVWKGEGHETWSLFPKSKKGRTQKDLCAQEPHGALLRYSYPSSISPNFPLFFSLLFFSFFNWGGGPLKCQGLELTLDLRNFPHQVHSLLAVDLHVGERLTHVA